MGKAAARENSAAKEEDWRGVAEHAVRAEASRRGLGDDYDPQRDRAGIADALIEALAHWRREAASSVEVHGKSPGIDLAPVPAAHLLCARWMRCPSCEQAGERFILGLADGRVVSLDGDLTFACPEGEALAKTSVLCCACGEMAPLESFR